MTAAMASATVPSMVNSVAASGRRATPVISVAEGGALVLLAVVALAMTLFAVVAMRGGTANDAWADARRAPLESYEDPDGVTIVLLVDGYGTLKSDEPLQLARRLGARGEFEVMIVPVGTAEVELALRAILLSDQICPPGACDPILILDLR